MANMRPESDHEKAFLLFSELGSKSAVSRQLQMDRASLVDWSSSTFACPYMCPWHDWDKLIQQRKDAVAAKVELLAGKIYDPEAHEQVIREVVPPDETRTSSTMSRRRAVETLVRSDIEVLAHYEFLYNKVFFEATGITLDHPSLAVHFENAGFSKSPTPDGKKTPIPTGIQLMELYTLSTLRCTNLGAAISTLTQIRQQIDELQTSMGVKRKPIVAATEQTDELQDVALTETTQQLSLEDLRAFRDMVENTPPEHIDLLKRALRADDAQVAAILASEDAPDTPAMAG